MFSFFFSYLSISFLADLLFCIHNRSDRCMSVIHITGGTYQRFVWELKVNYIHRYFSVKNAACKRSDTDLFVFISWFIYCLILECSQNCLLGSCNQISGVCSTIDCGKGKSTLTYHKIIYFMFKLFSKNILFVLFFLFLWINEFAKNLERLLSWTTDWKAWKVINMVNNHNPYT